MLAILHFSCKKCACKKVTLKRSFSTTFCALKKTNICNDISYLAKHSQLLVSVWKLTCQTCQNIFFFIEKSKVFYSSKNWRKCLIKIAFLHFIYSKMINFSIQIFVYVWNILIYNNVKNDVSYLYFAHMIFELLIDRRSTKNEKPRRKKRGKTECNSDLKLFRDATSFIQSYCWVELFNLISTVIFELARNPQRQNEKT